MSNVSRLTLKACILSRREGEMGKNTNIANSSKIKITPPQKKKIYIYSYVCTDGMELPLKVTLEYSVHPCLIENPFVLPEQ